MDALQSMGLVSDNAVSIDDCADADLERAMDRAVGHGGEIAA
jgi:hypothetical protein